MLPDEPLLPPPPTILLFTDVEPCYVFRRQLVSEIRTYSRRLLIWLFLYQAAHRYADMMAERSAPPIIVRYPCT